MAKYYLRVKIFSRGKGASATSAAAYRAGERIRDEISGRVHDFTDRTDVVHSEIMLPHEYGEDAQLDWARNRPILWNAVQRSGRQWNSRLAREVLVLLPSELTSAQRAMVTRTFSQELADRYHCAVDFAVHLPRANADQRSHHAHILMTSRQVGPQGLGAPTTLELSGTERHKRGLGPSKDELLWTRRRWAQVANEALRNAGLTADLDHRSYAARGIDRETRAVIPDNIFYKEALSGVTTAAGDNLRLRHRERLEARKKGPEELNRVLDRQREEAMPFAIQLRERRHEKNLPSGAMSREQLNAKGREYYKAHAVELRQKKLQYYHANATELKARQREYMRRRRATQKAAKAALGAEAKGVPKKSTQALGLPRGKALAPDSTSNTQNMNSGVQKWLAYRESQKGVVRQDPIERWKAYRKAQLQKTSSTRDHSAAGEPERGPKPRDGAGVKPKRGPKNDFGL